MPEPTPPASSTTTTSGPRSSCCPYVGAAPRSRVRRRDRRRPRRRVHRRRARHRRVRGVVPRRVVAAVRAALAAARRRSGPGRTGSCSTPTGGSPVAEPYAAEYPAHLHIDLLPELQGQGWGRRLIDTLVAALRERGVRGPAPRGIRPTTPARSRSTRASASPRSRRTQGVQAFGRDAVAVDRRAARAGGWEFRQPRPAPGRAA